VSVPVITGQRAVPIGVGHQAGPVVAVVGDGAAVPAGIGYRGLVPVPVIGIDVVRAVTVAAPLPAWVVEVICPSSL
jgi:hypothetical protein